MSTRASRILSTVRAGVAPAGAPSHSFAPVSALAVTSVPVSSSSYLQVRHFAKKTPSSHAPVTTVSQVDPSTGAHAMRSHKASATMPPVASAEADAPVSALSDDQIMERIHDGTVSIHKLETILGDCTRAVALRRRVLVERIESSGASTRISETAREGLRDLPYASFNEDAFYRNVLGANAESVIGYVPVPVGVAGPIRIDGRDVYLPLATTEGALIASTNRGCRAITESGGSETIVTSDGMSRAPVLRMPSLAEAGRLAAWVDEPATQKLLADAFASTTRFGRLRHAKATVAGRNVYLRFKCFTGDAMGMNMITKGVNEALKVVLNEFSNVEVQGLSGNMCTDKKPSAINWINGRGKSVVIEARITKDVLRDVLKTDADRMVALNLSKNLIGSAMAGSIGGYNAHASNLVTAVFLATGQDPAQNVESSNCITLMEKDGDDLLVSCTMPSIEVGTVGGGTGLDAQAGCLELLGVRGASRSAPGENAANLARIVAGSVLAGELSLMAALTTNDLLSSHLELNRKPSKPEPVAVATGATAMPTGTRAASTAAVDTSAELPGARFFAPASFSASETSDHSHDWEPKLSVP